MGKRKERRLAAMMAAGRRVKLDLFADPSGESSLQEEVGGNLNHGEQTGVPNSPSSSGQKENPLLLLGQYSDDEFDVEELKQPCGSAEDSSHLNGQVEERIDASNRIGDGIDEAAAAGDLQEATHLIKNPSDGNVKESNDASLTAQHEECVMTTEVFPDSSGMQIIGDVGGSWKVVMHAESNQCYYWNTVTGETSWMIPDGLVPEGITSNGISSFTANGQLVYPAAYTTDLASVSSQEIVDPFALGSSHLSNIAPSEYPKTLADECHASSAEERLLTASCYETEDAHSARLVQYGENLLQKMTVLEGSLNDLEWVKMEIEMRVSDCKALSSYGSSLLPFWWHTETRLKELESSISKLETTNLLAYKNQKMEQKDEHPLNVIENKPFGDADNTVTSPSNKTKIEACDRILENDSVKSEELSSESSGESLASKMEAETVQPEVKSYIADVDMDVDMEVDEETAPGVPGHTPSGECPQPAQALPSNFLSEECPPPPSEECPPPPPPDDEWIPPPPPENESAPPPPPPPPPEEPTTSCPPVVDIIPSYPEQSNLAYPFPAAEYYASSISEDTNVTYHLQAEGSHIVEHQPSSYNDTIVANPLSMPAEITPVDASAFYSFPAGIPPTPVVSSTEAAVYYIASGAVSYDMPNTGSIAVSYDIPNIKSDISGPTISSKSDQGLLNETPAAYVAQTLPSTSAVGGSAPSSTISKGQTKVVRNKKRSVAVTSTLRSNKKVSSLVDKWKAAKEELHGEDDDEPESAYEALERKRQKEIEEWRAHQIANGEAQDNANFVPLGSDWRERVKRRRAGAGARSETNKTPTEAVENEQKQPDVAKLSQGLPSGWQAYLDETSKQVYYGNSITTETSWIRPTK